MTMSLEIFLISIFPFFRSSCIIVQVERDTFIVQLLAYRHINPFERKVIMVPDTCSAISKSHHKPTNVARYKNPTATFWFSSISPHKFVSSPSSYDIVCCQFTFINLRLGLLSIRHSCCLLMLKIVHTQMWPKQQQQPVENVRVGKF